MIRWREIFRGCNRDEAIIGIVRRCSFSITNQLTQAVRQNTEQPSIMISSVDRP